MWNLTQKKFLREGKEDTFIKVVFLGREVKGSFLLLLLLLLLLLRRRRRRRAMMIGNQRTEIKKSEKFNSRGTFRRSV